MRHRYTVMYTALKGIVQHINIGSQKKWFLTLILMVKLPLQTKKKTVKERNK